MLQTNHQTENFRISTKLDLTCTKHSPWLNLGPVFEKFWQKKVRKTMEKDTKQEKIKYKIYLDTHEFEIDCHDFCSQE